MNTDEPSTPRPPGHPPDPPGHHPRPLIITRRIQILLQAADSEKWKADYKKLCEWQRIVARAANWIATHHYVQENLKDLFYLTEKAKLALLNTSRMSATYRLLSAKYKGQIPMAIISSLNHRIVSVFNKEKGEYRDGTRSLRTYKPGLPIPIVATDLRHLSPLVGGDYSFTLYGLQFRTRFGRDSSGNKKIFDRIFEGECQLHNSAIEMRKNKLFLLAALPYEKLPVQLSPDICVTAQLSVTIPILAESGEQIIAIGSKEEYLHRRLAIRESLQRMQAALNSTSGGKGRKKKMQALGRFHDLEKNYINTRLHQYSARLIAFCLRLGAGLLVLQSQSEKEVVAKEDEFLLRNWSYYGLKEKINYKAAKYGITVKIE
jgi:IS605 OrfB family transposase